MKVRVKKIFLILTSLLVYSSYASTFRCSKYNPMFSQIKKTTACDDSVKWENLSDLRETNFALFEQKIVEGVTNTSNVGGANFFFPKGPKLIFRSSFLAGPSGNRCLNHLVKKEGVNHIINLYNGSFKSADILRKKEKKYFNSIGGKKYTHITDYDYKLDKQTKEQLFNKISEIIRLIAFNKGNVGIHCYGGMHRTGVIYGVLQKCINKLSIDRVIDEYRCHVDYQNEKNPGGRHEINEEVIKNFPCKQLNLFKK